MSTTQLARTPIQAVVRSQLPEFIREDYPLFVSFVEAYYEYMNKQNIDLVKVRDLDETLDQFIGEFKKELAYNLPFVIKDERFLLTKIKEQYLSKGSRASYDLLFRLLYGKNVELIYPGEKLLIPSDGRWNQEISVFAQVDYGDANEVIGKLVDIVSAGTILRVVVDKKQELTGEVDKIVRIGKYFEILCTGTSGTRFLTLSTTANVEVGQLITGNGVAAGTRVVNINENIVTTSTDLITDINQNLTFSNELYEFFLDKRFFGEIKPGDLIKFSDSFQATIVPTTAKLKIVQPGEKFRVGQVFEIRSGSGTGALMKVTGVTPAGGIKYAEFIKFGIGYTTNFSLSLLPRNSITSTDPGTAAGTSLLIENTFISDGPGQIQATGNSVTVTGTLSSFGSPGAVAIGDEIWTNETTSRIIGVVKSIESSTSLTLVSAPNTYANGVTTSYSGTYYFRNTRSIGEQYTEDDINAVTLKPGIISTTNGFGEQGYINAANYVDTNFIDGTYAGTLTTEFFLSSRSGQVEAEEPAVIQVSLGPIAKYPGYFDTNNGFLNDNIYIQDSYYYQKFSYVVKIDERLNSYKSIVKTLVHPSGMALFGEFDIINRFDLSLDLESILKYLRLPTIKELITSEDVSTLNIETAYSSAVELLETVRTSSQKNVENSIVIDDPTTSLTTNKTENSSVSSTVSQPILQIGTSITDIALTAVDVPSFTVQKPVSSEQVLSDLTNVSTNKTFDSVVSEISSLLTLTPTKQLESQFTLDSFITVVPGFELQTSIVTDDSPVFFVEQSNSSSFSTSSTLSLVFSNTLGSDFSTVDSALSLTTKTVSSDVTLISEILISPVFSLNSPETTLSDIVTLEPAKLLEHSTTVTDNSVININVSTLNSIVENGNIGYVQLNPYYGQDYVTYDDNYSVGSRESTFN
jgi:hypothetical protein